MASPSEGLSLEVTEGPVGLVPQPPFLSLHQPVTGSDGMGATEIGYNKLSGKLAVFLSFFLMTE